MHLPYDSAVQPVQKHTGEWQKTADVRDLNDGVPGPLQLLHPPEAKKYTWYITTGVVKAFFSILLTGETRPQLPSPGTVCNTSGTGCY